MTATPNPVTSESPTAWPCVPPEATASHAPWIPDLDTYAAMHAQSITDPDAFWRPIIDSFHWDRVPLSSPTSSPLIKSNFDPAKGPVSVSFADDASTNICYNALDRWALNPSTKNRVAFHCEANEPGVSSSITYAQMHGLVCRFASVLQHDLGVKKGDVVILYMPMIPHLPAAMLACARIGAIHSVVFGGFSAEALAGRILDSKARVVVSAHSVGRGKKIIQLKAIADQAIKIVDDTNQRNDDTEPEAHTVNHHVVVSARGSPPKDMNDPRDVDWDTLVNKASAESDIVWVNAEDPLFILYTSGSTGRPKGVLHSTAGYMIYTATTFKYVFDYHADQGDVFFSTSDCGWITGHSYVTYGPMLNGASQVLYEGIPIYPNAGRLWQICQEYNVTQLYTAPTVIRSLKGAEPPPNSESSDDWVTSFDLSSMRVLGTVGEPINPEAWMWYYNVVGKKRCAIVDTWWQTETGGHCLTPLPIPGMTLKPGSAMLPFFGIAPALLNADGQEETSIEAEGFLVLKNSWPSTLRTVYGDHARMEATYFARFPGVYMTGDGARRDSDGHYWLTGRVDDILNVSGHRIGTAEVESAIVKHQAVAESAVVAVDHDVKGQALYAFVTLMATAQRSDALKKEIIAMVRKEIGPFAAPDTIHWAPALPKTRSGKIMRRILRKIAAQGRKTAVEQLGDTSTLTDPMVIDALLDTYGL